MNISHFSVRYLATVAMLLGSVSVIVGDELIRREVIQIDQITRTFTIRWRQQSKPSPFGMAGNDVSHERTYKATDQTIYVIRGKKGSWSDLRKGDIVHVKSHHAGSELIADSVQIVSGS
jgi:hypothetical protein